MHSFTRRELLKASGAAVVAGSLSSSAIALADEPKQQQIIHLNLNENAFGPSAKVAPAIEREIANLSRYGDAKAAETFTEQIAAYERVSPEQVVLGEILGALGLYLGSEGGPGGEFVYSTPGYLALISAAAHVGGVGVPVPLNAEFENDLEALRAKINSKTRAVYLINPHNPTGTVSDKAAFQGFLAEVSKEAPVIVDEAYLEYTEDFQERSAVSLVREGANVLVFRTFDKIYGLAGLPIGYTLAPKKLTTALRNQGLGDAESLGRLNIAAASAALADQAHVHRVRETVAGERKKWVTFLNQEKLQHTQSSANFVFVNTGQQHSVISARMREQGVEVGRAFPPYTNWVRISIGTPAENQRAQRAFKQALA